ncbi:MAG TPA: Gldg family protein [Saprospiraceae bacterium]|nr:Gldg family protein [Saprospiraceae bacterium]HMQ83346.1 Gldg family protein [Saprospiraceae bacterium]
MKKNHWITALLLVAVLLLLNLIAQQLFFRLDLTEDRRFTLSGATKDILRDLEDPITIRAFFSKDVPPEIEKARTDFQDLLVEYANISKGMVDYEFIDPKTDEAQQEAAQAGIQPVMINVRDKDQVKQQQAFLGAIIQMGEQSDVIPFIQPGAPMEYELSTGIKKLAVKDKPSIGLVQGHGEPTQGDLAQAVMAMSILYSVENLDLEQEASIPDRFKTIAIVAPSDTFPPHHLSKLDDYLSRGGNVFIAYNAVVGDLQTAQGAAINTGLESWLADKGLQIENSFLIDAQCGAVTVQQRQGFLTFNTPVSFPYLPLITDFPEHPINKGLEQVVLSFASPLQFLGKAGVSFTPIAQSSAQSGVVNLPVFFDIQKQWFDADFPMSSLSVGGILEGNLVGNTPSRMVVIGDGDFPVSGQQGRQAEDNVNLMVNSIDWLSDDTGLIELRTKGVATRPIDQEYLSDEATGKRSFLKYLNFGLPIALVLLVGFLRYQRQKSLKTKRMVERWV